MSVYRYAATLLDVSTPVNTAVEGDEYVVIPDDTDSAADHQQTTNSRQPSGGSSRLSGMV